MPPSIIFVRHGQAEHNATGDDSIPDPPLTPTGEAQCRELAQHLKAHCHLSHQIEAIICSPATRAIQTAMIAFDWLVDSGIRVEVDDLWQETSDKPCDSCSERSLLQDKFPGVDFGALDLHYPSKDPDTIYAFSKAAVINRGQLGIDKLFHRPEKAIAVVSHLGFLTTAVTKRHFANADFRIFRITGNDGGLTLTEAEKNNDRGGMGWSEPGLVEIKEGDFPPEPGMRQV